MPEPKLSRHDLDEIVRLVEAADHIAEFHLRYGDVEVRVSRSGAALPADAGLPKRPPPIARAAEAAQAPRAAPAIDPAMTVVTSPMVGTFYRAPAPGATRFVEIGQAVEPDSIVCIIEVMKLMNSIPAGAAGTVREILVADSQPVEFGQPLVLIEPRPAR